MIIFNTFQVQEACRLLLEGLGVDYKNNPNFIDTPARMTRMYEELLRGLYNQHEIQKILNTTFPTTNDQMVIVSNIKCHSLCPHHFAHVVYNVSVGYIPRKKVLGLSKLPRLIRLLCSMPQLQEDLTEDIAQNIYSNTKAQGVICVIKGHHACMESRGIRTEGEMITSALKGVFRKQSHAKQEFLTLI